MSRVVSQPCRQLVRELHAREGASQWCRESRQPPLPPPSVLMAVVNLARSIWRHITTAGPWENFHYFSHRRSGRERGHSRRAPVARSADLATAAREFRKGRKERRSSCICWNQRNFTHSKFHYRVATFPTGDRGDSLPSAIIIHSREFKANTEAPG